MRIFVSFFIWLRGALSVLGASLSGSRARARRPAHMLGARDEPRIQLAHGRKAKDAQREERAQRIIDRLVELNAIAAGAGKSALLTEDQRARRELAVAAVLRDGGVGADLFVQTLLARGEINVEALKREARSDRLHAAEKWRRIGALCRGVNDAEAFAAYREAYGVEPKDFETCIELSRLNLSVKRDVVAARRIAEAAERVAKSDSEKNTAQEGVANALVSLWLLTP